MVIVDGLLVPLDSWGIASVRSGVHQPRNWMVGFADVAGVFTLCESRIAETGVVDRPPATRSRSGRRLCNAWGCGVDASWCDLSERFGPWKTAHERPRLWTTDGTWARILEQVIVRDDLVGSVEWVVSVDSSVVRVHRHAAEARKRGLRRRS